MSRVRPVLLWTAGILVVALVAALGASWWTVRRSWPETAGTIELEVLDEPVEVVRDDHGIPHVFASTFEDLFRAQGYVHAQDRFWEMDFRRHVTAGRLSELFGESQIETDRFIRTLGWRRVAEQELDLLTGETRRMLEAYAEGVNAWMQVRPTAEMSLEYSVLGLATTPSRGHLPTAWPG